MYHVDMFDTCLHVDMFDTCLIHKHVSDPRRSDTCLSHIMSSWVYMLSTCRHVWYMSDTQTCIRHVSCDARAQTCCVFLSHMTDTNITCVREIHTVCVREIHVICVWETHILWMNEMHVISKTKKTEKCVFLIICKTKHVWRRDTCDMCEGDTHFMNEREEHNM